MRAFRLYPEERHWWSFNDYGAVLDVMARLKAAGKSVARVLEFGPGSSTLALIEGGAEHIDSCEDNPDWAQVYEERLAGMFPTIEWPASVAIRRYDWSDPVHIPAIDGHRYDFALIDGPRGSDRRHIATRYALERCDAVLVPTEDANPRLRERLIAMAGELNLDIDIRETGPLSGGFALLTRRPVVVSGPEADSADVDVQPESPMQAPQAEPSRAPILLSRKARRAAKRSGGA